ncbi:unnamed protein product, partial [Vitis vinifera]
MLELGFHFKKIIRARVLRDIDEKRFSRRIHLWRELGVSVHLRK